MKLVKWILRIVLFPVLYPAQIVVIMYRKHKYDAMKRRIVREKKARWRFFESKNKKWLHLWYRQHGLGKRPPVFYDPRRKAWFKLNRSQRRDRKY